jgi:hypothetical protein
VTDGDTRVVETAGERWSLTFYADGRDRGDDAVLVEVERNGHNFAPSLTAEEAGALIDALIELLPAARRHSKLAGRRRR